jgi:hypothetical protein
MDPNDPRKDHEKGAAKALQEGARQSLAPFPNAQSKRLFLMKARGHNPDLANIEIPLH